jgi:hypothetical protein
MNMDEHISSSTMHRDFQTNSSKTKIKTCHCNRKLQHFKRKCRARGLNNEQITTLIHTKNDIVAEQLLNDQKLYNQIKQSIKRKRDQSQQDLFNDSIKTISQLSISQEASKKVKNSLNETMLSDDNNSNQSSQVNITSYRPSKYLKMPRKLPLHSLRLQLNCSLKKKNEQGFLLSRLQIIDQIHYLYQTYFDLGLQHASWAVSLKIFLYISINILT